MCIGRAIPCNISMLKMRQIIDTWEATIVCSKYPKPLHHFRLSQLTVGGSGHCQYPQESTEYRITDHPIISSHNCALQMKLVIDYTIGICISKKYLDIVYHIPGTPLNQIFYLTRATNK